MATITTRVQGDSPKGSPLTNAEVDNNFINLNTAKYESGDSPSFAHITLDNGQDAQFLQINSGGTHRFNLWVQGTGEDYLDFRNSAGYSHLKLMDVNGVVINDSSDNLDFRVESNDSTHMLFVDATNNEVGINISGPESTLDVSGIITGSSSTVVQGAKILRGRYSIGSITTLGAEASSGGPVLGYGVWPKSNTAQAYVSSSSLETLQRSAITLSGNEIEFWFGASQTVTEGSDVAIDKKINLARSAFVFNEDGANTDFRVESDTNSNGLFFDASASALGINKQPDTSGVYALDIDGIIRQKSGLVAGIVYPYSGNVSNRAVGSGEQWYKVWESTGLSGSPKLIKLYLHCGGDNTAWSGEFLISLAGYNFTHSIELLDYQYYNQSKLLEIRTFNTGGLTDFEVWVKLDAISSSAGNLVTASNDSSLIAAPAAGTLPSNTTSTSALTSANWPSSSARSAKALSENLSMGNGAEIRLWRPEETRYSRIYHSSAGAIFETQNSGDNLYLRNSAGTTGGVHISNGYDGYEVTVNDSSYNSDFRVESDGKTHMLFVDGSANAVGINKSDPYHALDVDGFARFSEWIPVYYDAASSANNVIKVYERHYKNVNAFAFNNHFVRVQAAGATNGSIAYAEFYINHKQQQLSDFWSIQPDRSKNMNVYYKWDASGGDYSSGLLEIWVQPDHGYQQIGVFPSSLSGVQGHVEYGVFSAQDTNSVDQPAGSTEVVFPIAEDVSYVNQSGSAATYVINGGGADVDFRVESSASAYALFTEGSSSRTAINYSAPETDLHVNNSLRVGTNANDSVGRLSIYDTGNNLLELAGTGANAFTVDMVGTSAVGSLTFNDVNLIANNNATVKGRLYVDLVDTYSQSTIQFLNGTGAAGIDVGSIYAGTSYANRVIGTDVGVIEAESGYYNDGERIIGSDGAFWGRTNGTPMIGDGGRGSEIRRIARGSYYNNHSYIHIKTRFRHTANSSYSAVSSMYRFLVEGYAYGSNQGIDSVVVAYVYGGGQYLGSTNVHTRSGCAPVSVYMSSDGYMTITISCSTYYTTFSLSSQNHGGNGMNVYASDIISVTTNTSSTI